MLVQWSCGRVARQSSAKASTAVRIRSGPPGEGKTPSLFFYDQVLKMDQPVGICHLIGILFHAMDLPCRYQYILQRILF
ncbi:MAG: hypothetical protein RLZZ557_408 [Bacteroidota bacterium]